ncbi:glutamyl-tRNA amidotransferase [Betaproteobacteria bacterium GR16-43]|nr:glutamyl-tRNA amidotransferase [Betaproteobacteria bacterium GR16-43]
MALREQLNEDIKTAMKAREADKLQALRLLLSAVKQREVDERITLDDAGVIAVIEKMLKQRKDSIDQFEKAARADLADKEKYEVSVLQGYMPQQLSEADVSAIIAEAIASTGAKAPSDMGKVMGVVKAKVAGRADMGKVSALIKAKLTGG